MVAQETFVSAWKQFAELREPAKLRAWLCGIARNRINNTLRREGREPLSASEPLETAHESPASEPSPSDQAISREEEAILWRALQRLARLPLRGPALSALVENRSFRRQSSLGSMTLTRPAPAQIAGKKRALDTPNG